MEVKVEVEVETLDQVRETLGGHLCRCGTYPRIFEAVLLAAARGPAVKG